jgi:outer membrane protein assembly factor BamB
VRCAPEWSATTATGAAVSQQPAVAANVAYVGTSTGRVYAFAANGCDAASCPALWNAKVSPSPTPKPVNGVVVSDGTLYASAGPTLAAFRIAN